MRQRGLPVDGPGSGGRGPRAGVLHHGPEPEHPVGAGEFDSAQAQPALDLLGAPHEAAHRAPVGIENGLGVDAGRAAEREGDAFVAEQLGDGHGHLDPFLGALVPGHEDPVGQVQLGHVREVPSVPGLLDGTPLRVQEAQFQGEGRLAPGLHQDLGLLEDVLLVGAAPRRGTRTPNCQRSRFLAAEAR